MHQTLTITLEDAGRVSVTGPIENTLLCYGLLEIAKQVISDQKKAAEATIQPAGMNALAHLGRFKD